MRVRRALLVALALAAAPAAAAECRTFGAGLDLAVSHVPESPGTVAGFGFGASFRCLAASLRVVPRVDDPRSEPGFGVAALLGLGGRVDLHRRVTGWAQVVGGSYTLLLRDHILGTGKWRYVAGDAWAWGGDAGVALRVYTTRSGRWSFPLGLSVTALEVAPGHDRLRGVSWGGWRSIVTVSLGIEYGWRLPPSRRGPAPEPAPAASSPWGRPSPELLDAAAKGRWREVVALLSQGADPAGRDGWGASPLHLACTATSNEATVWHLLARGGDVRAVDATGATPLHWAVAARRYDAARLLLQWGADPNARAGQGTYTPLHAAAVAGDLAIARLLLEHRADVTARDAWGRTPLDVAEEAGHAEVAGLLRRAAGRR